MEYRAVLCNNFITLVATHAYTREIITYLYVIVIIMISCMYMLFVSYEYNLLHENTLYGHSTTVIISYSSPVIEIFITAQGTG